MATVKMQRGRAVPPPAPARKSRARPGSTPTADAPADNRFARIEMLYKDINDIVPYEFNPRDNEAAIESVANSIKLVGFRIPIVIDANNVLVCGHTRVEAAKRLGLVEVPAVLAGDLTEDQINAFRLIDNKVSELAKWDFDALAGEIDKLSSSGLTLTDFGWSRQELDCLSEMVADDCLSTDSLVSSEERERLRRAERRAPATARFVLGELVFFITQSEYSAWVAGIRDLCNYDEAAITAELKRRLGLSPE